MIKLAISVQKQKMITTVVADAIVEMPPSQGGGAANCLLVVLTTLISSPRDFSKSLALTSIRPLEQKLLAHHNCKVMQASYPGFFGIIPWFSVNL